MEPQFLWTYNLSKQQENRPKKVKKYKNRNKTGKNLKKTVETTQNSLTKRAERLKVNCGTVSSEPA
jgi:hypothetical protein